MSAVLLRDTLPGALAFVTGYAVTRVAGLPRTRRAVHVLRGRPMIYGLHYSNGAIRRVDHLLIDSCRFEGYTLVPAIEITNGESSLTRHERKVGRRLSLAAQQVRTARKPSLP